MVILMGLTVLMLAFLRSNEICDQSQAERQTLILSDSSLTVVIAIEDKSSFVGLRVECLRAD